MSVGLVTHPDGWRTIEPKPSVDELKAFYSSQYFQQSHGLYTQTYSEGEISHRDLVARLLLHALTEGRGMAAAGSRLLEIGCGEGWLLAAAQREGYDIQGLDFSDDGLKRFHPELLDCVKFGDAFENLDRLIAAGSRVDVCVMEHVLEHVHDPEPLLARLPHLLKPAGVVAITVPNDFSALQMAALSGGHIDREFWIVPPQHLSYFNTNNLPRLLRRTGFKVQLAYASFPIDFFLLHPGSNYIADPAAGKPAHRARMAIDLLMAEHGLDAYLNLARALFACGVGRSLTFIATPIIA
jgi:2-polyprenyl-3-methyl-5-hydroxy-6-metoxy-1,4-benzoquinol methylase